MSKNFVKFTGGLISILIILGGWFLVGDKLVIAIPILTLAIFLLFLSLKTLSDKIKKLEKGKMGLEHVLERSEENRKKAETLKNKFYLMIDELSDGLLVVNKDNNILFINNQAEKFLNISRGEILNRSILRLRDLSNIKKIVFPLLANFKGVHEEEVEVKKNLILNISIEPLVLAKNNIAKLITLQDITKIKVAIAAKNKLISVTVHQLKAPLSAIRASLRMFLSKDFGKITKKQEDILEKTYEKNESAINLVDDLLEESKVDDLSNFSNRSLINLEDSVSSVVEFYKEEIEKKKIDFIFNKSEEKLPKVFVDSSKVKMVIQNLLDNAIKYTPLKGKIEISIMSKDGSVQFKITDSGIGVPEDQKEKIFQRFMRADNAFSTEELGTGLGLTIAKDIIENHHGKIWLESEENQGSTFSFSLPIANN